MRVKSNCLLELTMIIKWFPLSTPLAVVLLALPLTAEGQVRILQSNAAGDRYTSSTLSGKVGRDPASKRPRGDRVPDGSQSASNEADDTLDVADFGCGDRRSFLGRPSDISITPTAKVYVGSDRRSGTIQRHRCHRYRLAHQSQEHPHGGPVHNLVTRTVVVAGGRPVKV